ncbi:GNAT family N-acetyltransferase [Sinorhizobium medicae]|jgi:L-amino acid N-acyltransferase YncA|uniref:GCN5-related N-acetyltransferase n=2 Tax=Sinorhizobium medicae TaxID=110321 RepID=A6UE23_SINMW|nr:GNAT family N-acetyltransferase [Sinorhizobium medicae]ABR61903.1 GCN5-related N-acetyltransferase [Sinorhizobium medicae WSM419]MBO1941216.1 N-acetyltransferase [Sinorhizobium medicae]MBO1964462.1 N-acetyltransferase [Sinorhizobium medicae]MDX0404486.1 GNAT family N-acetyltransferase [Sinorhizobium medicae]MDX0410423.1 GNAT family N-acetyltransferase [Sinorhizobium medicae]
MTATLRDAVAADLPVITGIYRESVLNGVASYEETPPTEAEMALRFSTITGSGYPYVVALDEAGAVIGYAYASAFRNRSAYRFVVEDSIYLSPAARGKGTGKALLSELIGRCTALGFRQMIAVIGGAHPLSIALHRALGFEQQGLIKATGFKHGRWLDTVFMQRPLGEGTTTTPAAGVYPDTLYRG